MKVLKKVSKEFPVVCWFSGGVTSAVAIWIAIHTYGIENCIIIFIDTKNEDDDTYRFKDDCEKWYGIEIQTISAIGDEYTKIQDVWYKYNSLNVATGAICSTELKREVREKWQKDHKYSYSIFGFDIDEPKRAKSMTLNHADSNPIYTLLLHGLSKKMTINMLTEAGIKIPRAYDWGFLNNNCLKTGCVQGGIGYWQKMQREQPEKFYAMAVVEHELSDRKREPVTMLKDQSNEAKALVKNTGDKTMAFVFLVHNPKYPHIKDISMMSGREPKPLNDCNGFCGVDDLERNDTENEINYSEPVLLKLHTQGKLF